LNLRAAPILRRRYLSFFLLTLLALPAYCADDNGDFVVKGVGALSCTQFVTAAESGGKEALGEYAGYIAGYTSAFNEMTPSVFDAWGWQSLDTAMLFLLQRCRELPGQTFGKAMAELTRFYAASGITEREETRRIGNETDGFELYESSYEALLAALRREGYSTEDPYAALMQYKTDARVRDTANVHQILLLRLIGRPGTTAVSPAP